ncbi:MAG: AMP-binding protein [Candidatus Sphingomonas phytovorans]|nr:AMP-binding protein [Sphingomonas sp.]WEK02298.1 MAG: AMP-binding protein [Sphingomonas sp.]
MRTLHDLLEQVDAIHSDRVAVSTHGTHLSYATLLSRSRRLASVLAATGLMTGDRVAIFAPNGFRYLEVNFACTMLGVVLVPLNTRLAAGEIEDILQRVGCKLLVGQALPEHHGIDSLSWNDADGPGGRNPYEDAIAHALPHAAPPERCDADTIAQIFFTSGTTGLPKGVCLTHGNLLASAVDAMERLEFRRDDVWLHSAPMFHLVDAFAIWGMSLAGGAHVAVQFDPVTFGELVERERISKTSLPPTLLDWISRQRPDLHHDLGSLRLISYGGSPMQDAVYRRCRSVLKCDLRQAYGLTEGSGFVCHEQAGDNPDPETAFNIVGTPTRHVDIALVDDQGRTVGPDEVGEIVLKGARLFREYWGDPLATARAFVDGWYHSGDLGIRTNNGLYRVVGRKKEMIISGGENIYPAEVVNALLSHPAVEEAAVFGIPSERWGEEVRAVIYTTPGPGAPTGEEIDRHCRSLIAGYKAPKRIDFSDAPLPKTGAGKIATAAIRERFLAAALPHGETECAK